MNWSNQNCIQQEDEGLGLILYFSFVDVRTAVDFYILRKEQLSDAGRFRLFHDAVSGAVVDPDFL